jgi:hypothetical protein
VAAGPAASLVWGGAALLAPFPKGLASGLFILASLAAGLIEFLPIRSGAVAFDGWRIARLLGNREWAGRWLSLMTLTADLRGGVPPEALPPDALARAVALRDDSAETVTAHAIAYSAAFHRHDDGEAARMLEVCLADSSHAAPVVRTALMSDAAVFQARRRGRADLAEQWLADMPATTPVLWLRTRAEAAILESRRNLEGATRKLDECEQAVLSLPLPTEEQRQMLLVALRRWRSELRAR